MWRVTAQRREEEPRVLRHGGSGRKPHGDR